MAITTNRQYLTASLSRFGITEQDIDLIMANYPKLDGAYSVTECRNAMFLSFSTVLPLANVSEGVIQKRGMLRRLNCGITFFARN